ncbi:MAG: LiaF domain-containing protein, partial [Bacteroidota bacterium]
MQNKNSKILIGVLLIIIGLISIAGNVLHLPFHFMHYLFSLPGLMMLAGLLILINHKNSLPGVILVAVGGYWFLSRYSDFPVKYWLSEFWPVLLILFGIYIILKREGPSQFDKDIGNDSASKLDIDYIDEVAILGGGKRVVNSNEFKGGKITAIMGGVDIDLHECSLAEGTHYIDFTVMFGGVDLYVPKDWRVIVNVTSIFGGFDDKRIIDPNQ